MIGPRSESRTEVGWQRFDRVAGLVSLLLVLALLIIWLARTDPASGNPPDAADSALSALTEPNDTRVDPDTDSDGTATAITPVVVGAGTAADANADGAADKLAMVDANASKGAAISADPQPAAGRKADEKKPESGKSKDEKKDSDKAQKVVADKKEPKKETTKNTDTKQASDAKAENANVAGKSLASQDPAKQATFERIPKYIDKSITAAGADAGTATMAPTKPDTNAATDNPVSDLQRSATSLVKQVPKVNSILEISSADGRLSIDGIVSSEQIRASILKAGLQAYGMRNLTDRLSVNAAVAPFDWADSASDLIVLIGGPESETTVRIDGESVTLTGTVNDLGDKQARALAAQQLFGTRARVDNRLKVVAKPAAARIATAKTPATKRPASEPTATPDAAKKPDATKAAQTNPAAASPNTGEPAAATKPAQAAQSKPAAAAAGQDPSQLAEGGPGQVDKVVMAPRGMPAKFSRGDCPRVMTGVRIRFRSASTEIPADGRAYLDRLKRCFDRRSYIVRGHTDSRGAALNNLILSQQRAQSVVDYLVSIGVSANRVSAKGSGESTPVDSNRTERGRARNRRIDFRFKR